MKDLPEAGNITLSNTVSAREASTLPPIHNSNGKNKTQIFPYDDTKDIKKKFEKLAIAESSNESLNKIKLPLEK